jgi:hypothetical protein
MENMLQGIEKVAMKSSECREEVVMVDGKNIPQEEGNRSLFR